MEYFIINNSSAQRFETTVDGAVCFLEYEVDGEYLSLIHTYVRDDLRGRGIAAELVKYAIEYASENGLKIHPVCSYVIEYIQKHKD